MELKVTVAKFCAGDERDGKHEEVAMDSLLVLYNAPSV